MSPFNALSGTDEICFTLIMLGLQQIQRGEYCTFLMDWGEKDSPGLKI